MYLCTLAFSVISYLLLSVVVYKLYWITTWLSIGYNRFMNTKFKYWIVPENMYQITVDDYDGNPYTFEMSGKQIAAEFRREALLVRQWNQIEDNQSKS